MQLDEKEKLTNSERAAYVLDNSLNKLQSFKKIQLAEGN